MLTETEFMKQMEMYRSGALSVRRGAQEPLYLAFKNLKPFIDKHLGDVHTRSVPFRAVTGQLAKGISAEIILHVCNVWLDARDAGVLGPRQLLASHAGHRWRFDFHGSWLLGRAREIKRPLYDASGPLWLILWRRDPGVDVRPDAEKHDSGLGDDESD